MHHPPARIGRFARPEGLFAALIGAALLWSAFAGFTAALPLTPAERWAALTSVALLALAVTLPGCSAIADGLGQTIRRDWRAYATLLAAFPALFLAYAAAVGAVRLTDLLSVILLVGVPGYLLWRSRRARRPTWLDLIGLGSLWLASAGGFWPNLTLPVLGGRVAFFTLAVIPLTVLLLAARGWPGLGFTWHLSSADLRAALLGALIGVALAAPLQPGTGGLAAQGVWVAVGRAIEAYFFVALPLCVLDQGVVQRGVLHALARQPRLGAIGGIVAGGLCASGRALLFGATGWAAALAALAAIGYSWAYWRTGKVTAAAVSQMLAVWVG